jgi:sortase A
MDDTSKSKNDSFEASLPLPVSGPPKPKASDDKSLAADVIRKKVEAAYGNEPDLEEEGEDIEQAGLSAKPSKHQTFVLSLMESGKPLHDIQTEWHQYYQGLTDLEKHQVWQEFYSTHAKASKLSSKVPSLTPEVHKKLTQRQVTPESLAPRRKAVRPAQKSEPRHMPLSVRQGLHSLAFGLSIGCLVLLILLFSFFNERFIAPFVQPSRHVNNIPLITAGAAVGTEPEVIIPKINVEIPVVYDVNTINDAAVDQGLERGVVHYADTALPGQNGNLVIVGHSSNNILNPGKYKFAFVLLSRLENGDTFYIQKDGKRYTYQVYKKTVVSPNDVSVLGPADKVATATLITCDPPGTSINRLVVVGQQISPDPIANTPASTTNTLAKSTKLIPGNSQSLWARIWSSL